MLAALAVGITLVIGLVWLANRGGSSGPPDYVPPKYEQEYGQAPADQFQMPNLFGMPINDAINYTRTLGLTKLLRGSGVYGQSDGLVSRQDPPAGTLVDSETLILISD